MNSTPKSLGHFETGFFDGQVMTTLLWQLGYQFEQIAGLIELGNEAEFRLKNPDKVGAPRQAQKNPL